MKRLLWEQYGLSCLEAEKASGGVGGETYFLRCAEGRYVLKYPEVNEMNHPEAEPALCAYLLAQGIPVSRFLRNREGGYVSTDSRGRLFHLQHFEEGVVYGSNAAPPWLLEAMAANLGQLHRALRGYSGLPVGIGERFFQTMTPARAVQSYLRSLEAARRGGDGDIEQELLYRVALARQLPTAVFDLSKLTCQATHGDYGVHQLLCGPARINATVDWTSACVHPVVWELLRSYVYAAPDCADGQLDEGRFQAYVRVYLQYAPLRDEDLAHMRALFFYQLAVCDYYGQYYASTAANRSVFLQQARFSTKLLRQYYR